VRNIEKYPISITVAIHTTMHPKSPRMEFFITINMPECICSMDMLNSVLNYSSTSRKIDIIECNGIGQNGGHIPD